MESEVFLEWTAYRIQLFTWIRVHLKDTVLYWNPIVNAEQGLLQMNRQGVEVGILHVYAGFHTTPAVRNLGRKFQPLLSMCQWWSDYFTQIRKWKFQFMISTPIKMTSGNISQCNKIRITCFVIIFVTYSAFLELIWKTIRYEHAQPIACSL